MKLNPGSLDDYPFLGKFVVLTIVFAGTLSYYAFFFHYQFNQVLISGTPYDSYSILLTAVLEFRFVLVVAAALIPLFWYRSRLRWESVGGTVVRRSILIMVGLLVWITAFHEYNYFYNQGFWGDRFLVVTLGLLTVLNPVWIAPLLVSCLVFETQFALSNQKDFFLATGWFRFDVLCLYQILFFTVSYLYTSLFLKLRESFLVVGWLAIVTANFFYPGLLKVLYGHHPLEWALTYRAHYYFAWSEFQGWLTFLPKITREYLYHSIKALNRPLTFWIFTIEIGSLFILVSSPWSLFFLINFIAVHLGVFLISGMAFWKWILLESILIVVLLLLEEETLRDCYTYESFTGFLVLLSVICYLSGPHLVWWETPYEYTYKLRAETNDGSVIPLSRRSFGPFKSYFDFLFSYHYFIDEKLLAGQTFKTTLRDKINDELTRPGQLPALKDQYGVNGYDKAGRDQLIEFMEEIFRNQQSNYHPLHAWLRTLSPPDHFQRYYHPSNVLFGTVRNRVDRVRVVFLEGVFLNDQHYATGEKTIFEINLDGP